MNQLPVNDHQVLDTDARAGRRDFPPAGSDRVYRFATLGFMALVAVALVAFLYVIASQSVPGWRLAGWHFFTSRSWDFGAGSFGVLPLVLGTLVTTLLALVLAVPVGVSAAVAIVFLIPPRLRLAVSSIVELLAVVPSIVYGVWGALVMVHWLNATGQPWLSRLLHGHWPFVGVGRGYGIMLGSIVLAVMIVPILMAVSRDTMEAVPKELVEGALSLGATRGQVIRRVVLPSCKTGITGAITLATGRALGETIALATLLGGVTAMSPLPNNLFATGSTLAAEIAVDFGNISGSTGSVLFCLALVLMVIVSAVTVTARRIIRRNQKAFS